MHAAVEALHGPSSCKVSETLQAMDARSCSQPSSFLVTRTCSAQATHSKQFIVSIAVTPTSPQHQQPQQTPTPLKPKPPSNINTPAKTPANTPANTPATISQWQWQQQQQQQWYQHEQQWQLSKHTNNAETSNYNQLNTSKTAQISKLQQITANNSTNTKQRKHYLAATQIRLQPLFFHKKHLGPANNITSKPSRKPWHKNEV